MNKEKLVEIFNELLEKYDSAEGTVIHSRGCTDDYTQLEKDVEEYRRKFLEALEEQIAVN